MPALSSLGNIDGMFLVFAVFTPLPPRRWIILRLRVLVHATTTGKYCIPCVKDHLLIPLPGQSSWVGRTVTFSCSAYTQERKAGSSPGKWKVRWITLDVLRPGHSHSHG